MVLFLKQYIKAHQIEVKIKTLQSNHVGYSWLSTWLRLDLAKTQAAGCTCEGFSLIGSFEIGISTLIESGPHLLVAAYKKEALVLCLLGLILTRKPILSLTLEPPSSDCWHILKTRRNIQSCELNNDQTFGLCVGREQLGEAQIIKKPKAYWKYIVKRGFS